MQCALSPEHPLIGAVKCKQLFPVPYLPEPSVISWAKGLASTRTSALDKRVIYMLVLNVHIKSFQKYGVNDQIAVAILLFIPPIVQYVYIFLNYTHSDMHIFCRSLRF